MIGILRNSASIWKGLTSGSVSIPDAPTGLSLTVDSDVQITLDWTNSISVYDKVYIERSLNGVDFVEIDDVAVGTDTYADCCTLTPYTKYYYRIRAGNGSLYSDYTNIENATTNYPSVISDGNTVAWYDSQLLSTITKDGSDFVSRWNDRLGSGHDLIQAGAGTQPLWSSNGILFDGINDFMQTATFTFNQPEFIYIVFKQKTWTLNDYIFDGFTNASGRISQNTSSPNINAYAGSQSGLNSNLAIDTFGIIRCLFNGASSKLIINETTPVTGDFGANNMSGFTLGRGGGGSLYSNIEVKEVVIRKVADGATDEASIYDYLYKKNI